MLGVIGLVQHLAVASPLLPSLSPALAVAVAVAIMPLFNINEDTALMRQRLFALDTPIKLTAEEHARWWPFVNNVWSISSRETYKSGIRVEFWNCRLLQKTHDSKKSKNPAAKQRNRPIREGRTYSCRIKVTVYPDSHYMWTRTSDEGHSHNLAISNQQKINTFLRTVGKGPVESGFNPPAVMAVMRGLTCEELGRKRLEDADRRYLTCKHLANMDVVWRSTHPDQRSTGYEDPWQIQLNKAVTFLEEHGYCYKTIAAARKGKEDSISIVFGKDRRLKTLIRRSYLYLIDSTHDTNYLRWYLYTIMVQDKFSSWIPRAHLLTNSKDSDILSTALKQIKQ